MQSRTHRHSIHCILPPDVLVQIAKNGTAAQRDSALRTLDIDQGVRTSRLTFSLLGGLQFSRDAGASAPAKKDRTIFDAHSGQNLPGDLVRSEGQGPVTDDAVNQAYDGLGDTFDFYLSAYQRNSIDNAGLPLKASVHYEKDYDNAFWNGQQMVFGDGDGVLFTHFTNSVDVIGHELTHGVTGSEANLTYSGQSGALNESISDVFGSLVKQYTLKQTADQADWLIGAGLLAKGVNGVALRSMKAPGTAYDDKVLGKDPQPGDMSGYVHTGQDNGGVHTNSGIPNHAFYLVAASLGGFAWERAGQIWYDTLLDTKLKKSANFAAFAQLTAMNAGHRYGTNSTEQQAVIDAWNKVGVKLTHTAAMGAGQA